MDGRGGIGGRDGMNGRAEAEVGPWAPDVSCATLILCTPLRVQCLSDRAGTNRADRPGRGSR